MARLPVGLLACFIAPFGLVAGQSPIYALTGLDVSLIPSSSSEQPDGILWKHKGNKVIEFDGKEEQAYTTYEGRVTLNWASAELNIAHLTREDSGDYELETYTGQRISRSSYKLEVIDRVTKPKIACEIIDGSSSTKSGIQAMLTCSAESIHPQYLLKFEWSSHGKVQPGPNLTISLGPDDEVYSCDVSNPLSNDRHTFTAKDCYPVKDSSVGLIVGLVLFFLMIIAVLLVLGYMFRRKLEACCCEKRSDLEKQSQSGAIEGSDEKTSQAEGKQCLFDRAPTLPSHQRLRPQTKETDELLQQGLEKNAEKDGETAPLLSSSGSASPHASSDKEDAEDVTDATESQFPPCTSSVTEKANELEPDGEDMQSDVQPSTAPDLTESEKETDEDKSKSAPVSDVTSPTEVDTVKLTDEDESDQVTGETTEKNHRGTITDDSDEEKQSSTSPEHKGSETAAHVQHSHVAEEETDTRGDDQQEIVKTTTDEN
ncbi:hypothetical protein PAMA_003183 [Pampus argenteus]